MKTVNTTKMKGTLLLLALSLLSFAGSSKEHITLSLENITSTKTTIEYDLFVVNDGSTAIHLSGCQFGVNYNGMILNGGIPTENAYTFTAGSQSQALTGLTTYSLKSTNTENFKQLRMTMSPALKASCPVLMANVPYKVGHFKFTNTQPWTSNSNPAFSLNEFNVPGISTCAATGYIDGEANPIGFSTAKKNLKVQVANSPILNPTTTGLGAVNATLGSAVRMDVTDAQGSEIGKQTIAQSENSKISVYPNPTQDILNIDLYATSVTNTLVKVLDIRGRVVKQIQARSEKGMNNMTISLREIANGVYTVQVYQDNKLSFVDKVTKKD